jgi:hypothetical protein
VRNICTAKTVARERIIQNSKVLFTIISGTCPSRVRTYRSHTCMCVLLCAVDEWLCFFFTLKVGSWSLWQLWSSESLDLRQVCRFVDRTLDPQVPLLRQYTRIQCLLYIKLTHVIGMFHEFVEQSAQYRHSVRRSCLRSHSVCWHKSVEIKFAI